jgi:hypothetical protein
MVFVRLMSLRKADGPLAVHVPSPGSDRPSWLGVGGIAAAGFLIGVAWPHLAGIRPGPSVPEGPTASASAVEPPPSAVASVTAPVVSSASGRPPSLPPAVAPVAAAPAGVRVTVAHGNVSSCKTNSGDVLKASECGALPGLDAVVLPRLRKLADCPAAAATNGRLRLVVRSDFGHSLLGVDLARDGGVPTAEALLACAKVALASASLEGIAHENARYTVNYSVTFAEVAAAAPAPPVGPSTVAPSAPPEANPPPAVRAPADVGDGTAQVEWDVAIVRDAPKTGKVVARLPRGTSLRVGPAKDGWYPTKYGDGFASEGWIYRGAIGR